MNLERWPISKPKPYESNPRVIPEKAVDKVAASLKEFGWRQPIVVDRDGVILVGHTRLKAANKLGLKEVPVLIADDLTPEQARAYRIADNRTNEETSWLDDVLSLELKALDELDFDLDLLGFDDRELMRLMTDPETDEAAEETPDVPTNPVTVLGDVWVLGNHRIICGDSTSADVVTKLLGPVKPHLMVTDPPYGVEYDASFRDGIKRADGSVVGARAKGKVLNDDRADWREAWALFPGEVAYVWHAGIYAGTVADSLVACDFDIRAQVIWAKNQFAIGRGHYHWQHEPSRHA